MTALLHDALDILEACGIDYMVVGSVSSSVHGQARATQDLDVVVNIDPQQLEQFLKALAEDRYYVSPTSRSRRRQRTTQKTDSTPITTFRKQLTSATSRSHSHLLKGPPDRPY